MILVGYYTKPDQAAPAFDPGLGVHCLVCWRPLTDKPRVTVSLMWEAGDRSYFFRAHKDCWEALSPSEQHRFEESVLGATGEPPHE